MDRKEKRATLKHTKIVVVLLILLAFIVNSVIVIVALTPKRYDLTVGDVVQETILAPRTIVDEAATGALRERAKNGVLPISRIDQNKATALENGARAFFSGLTTARSRANEKREDHLETELTLAQWDNLLTDDDIAELGAVMEPNLDRELLCAMLAAQNADIQTLGDAVMTKLSASLSGGLTESSLSSVKFQFVQELHGMSGISEELRRIGELVYGEYLQPTYVVDEAATKAAQDAAAAAVAPVYIGKGSVIIEAGGHVTAEKYALLAELDLLRADDSDLKLYAGTAIVLACAYLLFMFCLSLFEKEVYEDLKRMTILFVLILITVLLAFLENRLDPHMTPALIACMLAALLVHPRVALALNLLIALSMGMMASGAGSLNLRFDGFVLMISTIACGTAAVFALRKRNNRGAMIAAGAIGGGAAAIASGGAYLMIHAAWMDVLLCMGWALGSGLFSALLAVGSLSVWESLFDVATAARLNELSNANHPLLRQLMTEAPGTYHHSMMVAALAEAAAARVGADPLLARVGAYYHDVGKLRRPLYFMENQKPGENVHDALPPLESASRIISHQKDSVTLLTKHKLPGAVIQIASEHHGNSLMTFFYNKAIKEAGTPDAVDGKLYRYPGSRPSTKESAIVMLADCCEAAVRSLGDTSISAVDDMVKKVMRSKIEGTDYQMSGAPLTLADFHEIERAFVKTFAAIRHERIEYPDMGEGRKK